jgi:WD40 repeat protein
MGPLWDPATLDAVVQQEGVAALLDRLDASLDHDADPAVQMLREAVARSATILVDDPAQLPAQLVGRLAGLAAQPDVPPEIRALVDRTRAFDARAWLCPRAATLIAPGTPLRRVLRGLPDLVTAVAVSPDGSYAVSGSYGRDVRVWDLDRGLLVAHFTGERPGPSYPEGAGGDAITAVAMVADTVLAASADRCVYEIDRATGAGKMVVQGETDNLFAVALSIDGTTLVAGPKDIWGLTDYCVQVWDVHAGERTRALDWSGHLVDHVAVTPGGDRAAAVSHDGDLSVWDTATGEVLSAGIARSTTKPTAIALSPDGRLLAAGHENGQVVVRRATGDGTARELVTDGGAISALAFVDPQRLVCGAAAGDVFVADLVAGAWTHRTASEGTPVLAVAATPDLGTLVSGCGDGAARCWDVRAPTESAGATRTGSDDGTTANPVDASVRKRVEELETAQFGGDASSQHEVTAVAAAGRLALAASRHWMMIHFRLGIAEEETHVRLWDIASGELRRDLVKASRNLVHGGHVDTFRCVALSADGSLAAAGSDDRTLRLWDAGTGRQVAAFTADSALTACTLSPDGMHATVGEASGRQHRLDLTGAVGSGHQPQAIRLFPEVREGRDPEGEQVERRRAVVGPSKKHIARTVEDCLERYGLAALRVSGSDGDGIFLSTLGVEGHDYQVSVTLLDELGQLEFRIGGLLHATLDDTPADRVHGLLLSLSVLNYRIPLGALGYDPTDGEVALRYAMPVTGGDVRYEDFEQVLVVLQNVLAKHAADLRAVVAGERTAQEILR